MLGDVHLGKMATRDEVVDPVQEFHVMHLEPRPFRQFSSSEEYLYAMKEDLAEWLNSLYELDIKLDDFMEKLETGVVLCRHANNVMRMARDWHSAGHNGLSIPIPERDVVFRTDIQPGTFHARDNVSNFISWCRALAIKECLLFETDDLVLRKNERSFILCLLEVARRGAKFGMPAPLLVQMEQEIDAELAKDGNGQDTDDDYETLSIPPAQIITNDLRSLHERVVELLSRCTCPSQFPMIRVAEGKYRIGDTKVLIFVRILRNHIMVRVGGGWDTLGHYLDKHDPCRCRSGHRLSTSAKLEMQPGKAGTPKMQVTYNRGPPAQFGSTLGVRPSSSVPTSPQTRRRSFPSPQPDSRRCSNPDVEYLPPDRGPSRNSHCSDDSSASSVSLQRGDSPECGSRLQDSPNIRVSQHLGDGPPDASESDGRVTRRQKMMRVSDGDGGEMLPSFWRCSPQPPFRGSRENLDAKGREQSPTSSRIPTPTGRSPLRSQRMVCRQKSQSSEDLYRSRSPSSSLFPHRSRGSSPVSSPYKGRRRTSADSVDCLLPGLPRSRSQASDSGFNFDRGGPGRYSYRTPRAADVRPKVDSGNRTWTFRQRSQRPSASPELYRARTSPQRSPTRSADVPRPPTKAPAGKQISPLLEKFLQDDDLDSDEKILQKMELLINQYKAKVEKKLREEQDSALIADDDRSGSRRDAVNGSPSKIPIPTWQRRD